MIDYAAVLSNTSGSFPDIEAVNVSAPGAGDGTEFVAAMVNDIWGRAQAVMDYAGLTPDSVQEAPDTAQFLEALNKGWGIGPGCGVIYWKDGTPSANGDRVLLLQGQVVLIANYSLLVAATYIGDGNNADTDYTGFFKTSDAGGTTRDTAGPYFVLPDTRGLSLKNIGDATVNGRTKTGPVKLTELQEDQFQGFRQNIEIAGSAILGDAGGPGSVASDSDINDNPAAGNEILTKDYRDDGVNGTPRTGANTRDSAMGTNFGITY